MTMLGTFVSIEGVSYCFRRLILDYFEPLHKRLRPCAVRASPFCRLPRRCQDSPRRFDHAYNSTPIPATVMFRRGIKLRRNLPGVCLNWVRFARHDRKQFPVEMQKESLGSANLWIPKLCRSSIDSFREIRGHVTSQSKHLIALQNILSKSELTEAPGCDEKSFAELKRILNQRIQDLQNCAAIPPCIAPPAKTANNAD
jgi:hypothetical protein